jgi:CheY-like chemotaxis protein
MLCAPAMPCYRWRGAAAQVGNDVTGGMRMATILVIDDEPQIRRVIRQALIRAGHDVAEAADGAEGLAHARAAMPDLIITDIMMPNREGIETIRDLRREAPALPILVISGNAGSALYMEMAKMLGAHAALAKPFRSAELLRAVEDLLAPS